MVPTASFRWLFALGLASRVAVLLIGTLLASLPRPAVPSGRTLLPLPVAPTHAIDVWYRFDALNYLIIARYGYDTRHPELMAFPPTLPLLIRAGAASGLDEYVSGLLVTNLAFAVGLALFGRAVWMASKDDATTWRACVLLAAAPTAFFFSAPYQESLGFLFGSAALYAWLCRRSAPAAVSAAVATSARQTAVALSAAVLVEWLADLLARRRPRASAWAVAVVGTLGYVLFALYTAHCSGDPNAQLTVQAHWGRRPPSPGNIAGIFWESVTQPNFDHITWLAFLGLGVFAWWKAGPLWGTLVLCPLAIAASTGTVISMKRLVLACYPGCYPLALVTRRWWTLSGCLLVELTLQGLFLWRYLHGAWVG